MQVETYIVTLYRREPETLHVGRAAEAGRRHGPCLLGVVERTGSDDWRAFFTRAELLAHLGFRVRERPVNGSGPIRPAPVVDGLT